MDKTAGKIMVAMSGGVDSSVAAHLLTQEGHEVIGVFMRHGEKAVSACNLMSIFRYTILIIKRLPPIIQFIRQ